MKTKKALTLLYCGAVVLGGALASFYDLSIGCILTGIIAGLGLGMLCHGILSLFRDNK